MVTFTPVIMTGLPVPLPFAIVTFPELGTRAVDAACTDTIVPFPLLISGLASGKDVSFAKGTNPPTSSIRSIILALIAAVVATLPSVLDQGTPLVIVSELSCLRNKASASVSV